MYVIEPCSLLQPPVAASSSHASFVCLLVCHSGEEVIETQEPATLHTVLLQHVRVACVVQVVAGRERASAAIAGAGLEERVRESQHQHDQLAHIESFVRRQQRLHEQRQHDGRRRQHDQLDHGQLPESHTLGQSQPGRVEQSLAERGLD